MKRGELHQCTDRHHRHLKLFGDGGLWVVPAGLALSVDGSKFLQECKGCHKVSARQAQERKVRRDTGAAYARSQWAKTHENAQKDAAEAGKGTDQGYVNSRLAGAKAACEAALTELSSQLAAADRPVMVAAWSHGVGSNEENAENAGVVGDGDDMAGQVYESARGLAGRVHGRGYLDKASAAEINSTAEATTQVALARTTGRADTHLAEAAVEWVLK